MGSVGPLGGATVPLASDGRTEWYEMVEWTKPGNSRGAVKRASKSLVAWEDYAEYLHALSIVNNWRSAHSYPLQAVMMLLRNNAHKVDPGADVVRRLKRLHSIIQKLQRTNLDLLQMQDLGGCRAVVTNTEQVSDLVRRLEKSRTNHDLYDRDDYISSPKITGYRSYHLMFKYRGDKSEYNGLRVEMQIRSRAQHWWATAVETVGLFITQDLKGSLGDERWLRFFALMGSVVADREGCPIVPDTPLSQEERRRQLRILAGKLDVLARLNAYRIAVQNMSEQFKSSQPPSTFLLILDAPNERLMVLPFPRYAQEAAEEAYERAEAENAGNPGVDSVLVSADSIDALRRGYPNYFADTSAFAAMVADELA